MIILEKHTISCTESSEVASHSQGTAWHFFSPPLYFLEEKLLVLLRPWQGLGTLSPCGVSSSSRTSSSDQCYVVKHPQLLLSCLLHYRCTVIQSQAGQHPDTIKEQPVPLCWSDMTYNFSLYCVTLHFLTHGEFPSYGMFFKNHTSHRRQSSKGQRCYRWSTTAACVTERTDKSHKSTAVLHSNSQPLLYYIFNSVPFILKINCLPYEKPMCE